MFGRKSQEGQRPLIDRIKEGGVKTTALIAIGAAGLGLTACGPSETKATGEPTPTISAPVTPGTSETPTATPSASETTAPVQEVDVTKSDYYTKLPAEQQTRFKELYAMSPQELALVGDWDNTNDRELVANVILHGYWDTVVTNTVREAVIAANYPTPVEKNVPFFLSMLESAKIEDVTNPTDHGYEQDAYRQVMMKMNLIGELAKTGDPQKVKDAKMLAAGVFVRTANAASDKISPEFSNILARVDQDAASHTNTFPEMKLKNFMTTVELRHVNYVYGNLSDPDIDGYTQYGLKYQGDGQWMVKSRSNPGDGDYDVTVGQGK